MSLFLWVYLVSVVINLAYVYYRAFSDIEGLYDQMSFKDSFVTKPKVVHICSTIVVSAPITSTVCSLIVLWNLIKGK